MHVRTAKILNYVLKTSLLVKPSAPVLGRVPSEGIRMFPAPDTGLRSYK